MKTKKQIVPQPIVFLKTNRLYLRPLELTDIERCTRWVNDPDVRDFITITFPVSTTQEQSYISETFISKDNVKLAIVTNRGVHIGNITIHKIDWINRYIISTPDIPLSLLKTICYYYHEHCNYKKYCKIW